MSDTEHELVSQLRWLNPRACRAGEREAQRAWAIAFARLAANRGIRARVLSPPEDRGAVNITNLAREVGVSKSTAYARLRLLADDGNEG